eukprot:109729_1
MIGTKMQKFIQSMPQLLELINNLAIEHECNELHNLYSILDPLLKAWIVLHTAMCRHNQDPFNNQYILKLKVNLAVFQQQYDAFIKVRGRPNAKGMKHHYLVHLVEFCEFYRWSPSWVDDQRQETIHQLIRFFGHRYKRYNKEGCIDEMVKALNNCTFTR